jgi:hypothetical protein
MKIRFDFVTNSSSTSFVIISKGQPSKDVFLTAMGASKSSPLRPLFENLFGVLQSKMKNVNEAVHELRRGRQAKSIAELVERELSKAAAQRAEKALAAGEDVWIGELDSDAGGVEAFFCCESFELDHPRLHVDANQCAW